MGTQRPAIVVHGGAGEWRPERRQRGVIGVKKAAEHGFAILRTGGAALDAVESAVKSMEDDSTFNAGLGSSLALSKGVEMEASIMEGKTLSAGAVGLLRDVRYPVHLARLVMEHTDHIFVVGRGALRLAEIFNVERRNSKTALREKYWAELAQKLERGELSYLPKLHKLLQSHPHLFDTDTVGAVAVDQGGNVAAATSTGGISLKIPGRIGDSPLIGCGNYADNEAGACSATGIGEIAIKLVLAKSTCEVMRGGQSPQNAVEVLIGEVNRRIREGVNHMGLIAIDTRGRIGAAHNSSHMCWAYVQPRMSSSRAFVKAKVVKKAV
jgi:beta-aspartyl-peptidase (threonine type)